MLRQFRLRDSQPLHPGFQVQLDAVGGRYAQRSSRLRFSLADSALGFDLRFVFPSLLLAPVFFIAGEFGIERNRASIGSIWRSCAPSPPFEVNEDL
jgi:hypothetical protein